MCMHIIEGFNSEKYNFLTITSLFEGTTPEHIKN